MTNDSSEDPKLPGINWDRVEGGARKQLVSNNFLQGGSSFDSLFSSTRLGNTSTRAGFQGLLSRRSSRRLMPANQTVINALALTDIPNRDLREGGSWVSSDNPSSQFSQLGPGSLGHRTLQDNSVVYDRRHGVPAVRSILTHELAHTLQADLPKKTLEVELDKKKRASNPELLRRPSKEESEKTSFRSLNEMVRTHSIGRWARYDKPSPVDPKLHAVSFVDSQTAVSEGSAEGYRKKFEGDKASPPKIGYSPEAFRDAYHSEGTSFGDDAANAYSAAEAYTTATGRVVPDSLSLKSSHLAGVLKSDLSENGERQTKHDIATSHRMATYLLHLAQGGDPRSHPHAEEYAQRRKAIEGETVQGSMFPDIVPETDQFGGAVTGDPERSERGTALFRGDPTERPHHLTLDAEARRQKKISDKRQANAPGEPYRSAYRYRLERAVADKKDRDARQAANQQRVSDGTLHPKIDEWLKKLVYDKKKNYAREYALARQSGSEIPQTPAGLKEEHAQKAREGIEKIIERHKIL